MESPSVSREHHSTQESESDHIARLQDLIPSVCESYDVLKTVGHGTFSRVYLGTARRSGLQQVAIKHIIPTSHPSRVITEIKCLQLLGGSCNVVGVVSCHRHINHIALAMPYFRHNPTSEYIGCLDVSEVRNYLANLLHAMQHVHSHGLLHRDVKPANFLYYRPGHRYCLVDFGLAQELEAQSGPPLPPTPHLQQRPVKRKLTVEACDDVPSKRSRRISPVKLLTPASLSLRGGAGCKPFAVTPAKVSPSTTNGSTTKVLTPAATRLNASTSGVNAGQLWRSPRKCVQRSPAKKENCNLPLVPQHTVQDSPSKHTRLAELSRRRAVSPAADGSVTRAAGSPSKQKGTAIATKRTDAVVDSGTCRCYGRGAVCRRCQGRSQQVAARAGTPGFRPPEVLLRHPSQTTGVDIWACGVVGLCLASGRHPFFRAPDDQMALAELCVLFSTKAIRKTAAAMDKLFLCNMDNHALDLAKVCEQLRTGRGAHELCSIRCKEQLVCVCAKDDHYLSTNISTPTVNKRNPTSTYIRTLLRPMENYINHSKEQRVSPDSSATTGGETTRKSVRLGAGGGNTPTKTMPAVATEPSPAVETRMGHSRMFSGQYPDEMYSLLKRLLDLNPNTRITADQALQHPFLKGARINSA